MDLDEPQWHDHAGPAQWTNEKQPQQRDFPESASNCFPAEALKRRLQSWDLATPSTTPRSGSQPRESDGGSFAIGGETTLMICNIPYKCDRNAVEKAIHSVGFAGVYDFVSVPHGNINGRNLGYALVTFKDHLTAQRFACTFENFQFSDRLLSKKCTVKFDHQHGLNTAAEQ